MRYKTILLSLTFLLPVTMAHAQDTTVEPPAGRADTSKLEIALPSPDPFPFQNRELVKAFFLRPADFFHSHDLLELAPTPQLFGDDDSFEKKLLLTQEAKKTISLSLERSMRENDIAVTIGTILGAAAWGGVIYQMTRPQTNPNLRPGGPRPQPAPAPQGNPRPMR